MKRMKNILNRTFLIIFAAVLVTGLIVTLFFAHEKNEYENRYAEKVPLLTLSGYRDGTFQSGMESALSDQIPYAERMKRFYNEANARFTAKLVPLLFQTGPVSDPPKEEDEQPIDPPKPEDPEAHAALPEALEDPRVYPLWETADKRLNLSNMDPAEEVDVYLSFSNGISLYRNHLVYGQQYLMYAADAIDRRAANVNEVMKRYPEPAYYAYYIEKDSDIDFRTNVKSDVSDRAMGMVELPKEQKTIFRVNDFSTFSRYFYKVDHHWNCFGSYEGYRQVLKMILPEEEPILPTKLGTRGLMNGSKCIGSAQIYTEELRAYEFDFPEFTFEINQAPAFSNGILSGRFKSAEESENLSYTNYAASYGYDNAITTIRNASSENGNILLIGESYDNAILNLLACHFSEVHSVDLRNYEAQMGEPFRYGAYLEEHAIETVLFIGAMEYWYGEAFYIGE